MTTKTRGEEIFAEYLSSLGLPFDYEPPLGQRPPDFLVHAPCGDVLCEIKDLEPNDEDRAEMNAAQAGQNTVSSREIPFGRIRRRIRKASEQLREYKGRYPCLVVLCDPLALAFLGDFTVRGAMHGDIYLSVPIAWDDETDIEATSKFDKDSSYLTRTSNTTVSAVAILEYVSPLQRDLEEALSKQEFDVAAPDHTRQVALFVTKFGEEHPQFFDRVPRLHVFRNVFAAVPWPVGALNGPYDLLWTDGDKS